MDKAALQYSKALANDSQVAFVKITKRRRRVFAGLFARHFTTDALVKKLSHVAPLLDRHLRHARQRLAMLIERCRIANHKYFRMFGDTEVILDAHSTGAVCLRL